MDVRAQNELSVIPGLRALKNVLTPLRTAKLCQCSSLKTNAKAGTGDARPDQCENQSDRPRPKGADRQSGVVGLWRADLEKEKEMQAGPFDSRSRRLSGLRRKDLRNACVSQGEGGARGNRKRTVVH